MCKRIWLKYAYQKIPQIHVEKYLKLINDKTVYNKTKTFNARY